MNLATEVANLSRQNLAEFTVDIARPGEAGRPLVRVVQINGHELAVKDYAAGSSPFRRLLGRYLLAREKVAYQRLRGVPGVPRYYGVLDSDALALQHIRARRLSEVRGGELPADFFVALADLVGVMHSRGVAHGDLRAANILVENHGQPVVIDFASSVLTGSNPLSALLFPPLCDNDWHWVRKLKQRITPHLLTAQEARLLGHRRPLEHLFRRWREPVRSMIKRWANR